MFYYTHLASTDVVEVPCLWSCPQQPLSEHTLSSHILSHLSSTQPLQKDPSQSDTITLPSEGSLYPISNPTSRPPFPSEVLP